MEEEEEGRPNEEKKRDLEIMKLFFLVAAVRRGTRKARIVTRASFTASMNYEVPPPI